MGVDAIAEAVISTLWESEGHEVSLSELRKATAETRSRYGGATRFPAALAMLKRRGLIWTLERDNVRRGRVGLTQRAIALAAEDLKSLLSSV